jgi:DNA repair protein RecO (recombination protein O)
MPAYEAEAVVLRQYSLAESDRIVILFTRESGKVRAVAKGAKKPGNRLAPCLEPLNHIFVEFSLREGHDLAYVREAELLHSYLGKSPSLEQVFAFNYFAEIINEMSEENNPNTPLFRLLLASLNAGEQTIVSEALVRYFEYWCLRLSGLMPNYDYCSSCGKCVKHEEFFFLLEVGQVRCRSCARGRGIVVRSDSAEVLRIMSDLSPEQFASHKLSAAANIDLESLTQRPLVLHLEKPFKSYAVLKQALRVKQ